MAKNLVQLPLFVPPGVVTLVTCGRIDGFSNIITLSETTVLHVNPSMLGTHIVPEHYSYSIIKENGEFVLNYPTVELIEAIDYCGINSGRDVDKFAATGLTKAPGKFVSAPLIAECPINIECVVVQNVKIGIMEYIIGEVKAYHVEEGFINSEGRLDLADKGFIVYGCKFMAGEYMSIGKKLGDSGLSRTRH